MTKPHIKLKLAKTNDGLVNVVSGLGTGKGKRDHNRFVADGLFGYQEWEAAYSTNWIARQIVDIPADDMTREWRVIKCEDADIIRQEEDRLSLQSCVNEALSWARLYGGSAILPLTNQDFEKPFRPDLIKKGEVQRLMVFDRWDLIPHAINTWDVLADNYLQPEYYTLYQGSQKIHWTHFIRFVGAKLPRRQRVLLQGWGDSELRKCLSDIKDTVSAKDGIAELMQSANLDVITREGLAEELTTDQEAAIIARYALFDQMKSIINTALLDSDEKLDRLTLNMSGIAPVLETFMVWISGAADIPVTRLFGRSAAGMNATGEGDLKNYYDSIRSKQTSQLDRPMSVLDAIMVRSAVGTMPDDYNYDWNRLFQPNRKEEAEAAKIEAETDVILLDAGVVGRGQAMRRQQSAEVYQYEEGVIEKIEASEDMSLFDRDDLLDGDDPVRAVANDAAPMPLYVHRKVKNGAEIVAWAKSQGLENITSANDLHVTVAFSREPVDWMKAGNAYDDGGIRVSAGGPRLIERFGEGGGVVVLTFNSYDLSYRHEAIKDAGASWDWPEYQPHITISHPDGEVDISGIKPYQGPIELGPEIFEPLDTNWKAKVELDGDD